jgi:hypothetical protein
MGYIPHVVMPTFKEDIYQQTPDQRPGGPRTSLGSYPPRYKTKDQPMPQAWVPWTFPGALDISRDFNYLVPDQEPQSYTGGPLRGLYCLVPDQEPQSSTGGPLKGLYCLVPDQEPQSSTGGPLKGLYCLVPDQETPGVHWGPLQGSFAMALTVWSQTKNPRGALGALDLG